MLNPVHYWSRLIVLLLPCDYLKIDSESQIFILIIVMIVSIIIYFALQLLYSPIYLSIIIYLCLSLYINDLSYTIIIIYICIIHLSRTKFCKRNIIYFIIHNYNDLDHTELQINTDWLSLTVTMAL